VAVERLDSGDVDDLCYRSGSIGVGSS
jgi:hypothetical protein